MTELETKQMKTLNELALFTSADFEQKFKSLQKLCQALSNDLTWGFAFSFNLFIQGGYDSFNDFDILLKVEDGEEILKRLKKVGARILPENQKGVFSSPFYREAYLDKIHIDLIGKCSLSTFNTSYFYDVNADDIEWIYLQQGIAIPVIPVEACLLLYGMMVGWQANRQFKVDLCIKFLQKNGVQHPHILQDALETFELPSFLKEVVTQLL